MPIKTEEFTKPFLKQDLPDIRPGDTVKVHQRIKEIAKSAKRSKKQEEKERIQVFEGVVLAQKHGGGISGTFTVRKIIDGIGVEKTFPLHSPNIQKIEVVSRAKVKRAKLYYLRDRIGKKAKLKRKQHVPGEETIKEPKPSSTKEEAEQEE